MSTPTVLNHDLLDQFEARLLKLGVAIIDAWAPGLTDEQIDSLALPLGIKLPEEARVWWRWHNGIQPGTPPESWDITPGRSLFTLKESLDLYAAERERMQDRGFANPLLNPVSKHPIILFHCAGAHGAPVPVYSQGDWAEDPRTALPSIGELVLTWISYIDEGFFETRADGSWCTDRNRRYPPDVWDLGVY